MSNWNREWLCFYIVVWGAKKHILCFNSFFACLEGNQEILRSCSWACGFCLNIKQKNQRSLLQVVLCAPFFRNHTRREVGQSQLLYDKAITIMIVWLHLGLCWMNFGSLSLCVCEFHGQLNNNNNILQKQTLLVYTKTPDHDKVLLKNLVIFVLI